MENPTVIARVIGIPAVICLLGMAVQFIVAPGQDAWGFFEMLGFFVAFGWLMGELIAHTQRKRSDRA